MAQRQTLLTRLSRLSVAGLLWAQACSAQIESGNRSKLAEDSWSVRMATALMNRHPDTLSHSNEARKGRWTYEQGVALEAIRRMWVASGDDRYFAYIKKNIDQFVTEDGSIKTYEYDTFNLDNIATGRQLLMLYRTTHDPKYRKAARVLRDQLADHPRTKSGGFWHKKIYPYQMWLDGIYMAEPFYAQYALTFDEPASFDDIAHQIILIEERTRDSRTGLLYHAWDESRQQRWADSETGHSPNFWGRAMGWYAMGIVDLLDYLPENHAKRGEIISILQRLSEALIQYQDPATGLWYQVVDQGARAGNYLEASASCMFAYAFARGASRNYLHQKFLAIAEKAFKGVVKEFVTVDEDGLVSLHQTCQSAGLGGTPYRDGSYEYYVGEPRRTNDFKGIGPFIFAALELNL